MTNIPYQPLLIKPIFNVLAHAEKQFFSKLVFLCKSKATGLDQTSARLNPGCLNVIAESLCTIFNCPIDTGIFPDDWKSAKVLPLLKQGEHTCMDMGNYCSPISIIPIVAKVFERIIYNQAYAFLTENELISSFQSGF